MLDTIVTIKIQGERLTADQEERLRGHFAALARPGGQKLRNLMPVLNVLSTGDAVLDIDVTIGH